MSTIKSTFGNLKGHQIETTRQTFKFENRHFLREAHGIHEGTRKDKKIPIARKYK